MLRLMTRGCTNKEIAGQLNLSEGTIKVHVNNVLQKLGSGSRTEAVGVALRRGLVTLG